MVARRRHKKFKSNFLGVVAVFIVIVGISMAGLFMYKSRIDKQMDALIESCRALPSDSEVMNFTGTQGNVNYSFEGPAYLKDHFEEGENGDYFFAIDTEEEKSVFYVYVFTKESPSNYTKEVLTHIANANIYDSQAITNNKNPAIYLESKNMSRVPTVMTIEHPSLCGNHFEFNCISMCDIHHITCEEIFNSLVLKCADGTEIVSEELVPVTMNNETEVNQ